MKKTYLLSLSLITLLLSSCSNVTGDYSKIEGNDDFIKPGNIIEPDFKIDGVLDNEEWNHSSLKVEMGNNEVVKSKSAAKVYFGDKGLSIGFYTFDTDLASSNDFSDPEFVVNSDNVEFYIDTKNDKGKYAKDDDFTFLVNPGGYIQMRNGNNSGWGDYSGVVDYEVKVDGTINNDMDVDIGWGCEIFLPYSSFGFEKTSIVGVAFGTRDKKTNERFSDWAGWIPDPQIIDTYIPLSKNGIEDTIVKDYKLPSGNLSYKDNEYITTKDNTLAINTKEEFSSGSLSLDLHLDKNKILTDELGSDDGIVFKVKEGSSARYFEGEGISYFFFFISRRNIPILGKTSNSRWITCQERGDIILSNDRWVNLKVELLDNKIKCFVDNKLMFTYETLLDEYNAFGFRSTKAGTRFKNIEVSRG